MSSEWERKTIKDVAEIRTGGSAPQGSNYFEYGQHPFIRVQHFDGTSKYVNRWDLITPEAVRKYKLKVFPKESIIFPKSGASIRLEKRAKLPIDSYVVGHLCVLKATQVESDFLYFYLLREKFARSSDGSTLPFLNLSAIADREILVPSRDQQQQIISVLSTIQSSIENQEKIIQTTTELKNSLMSKLFSEGFRGGKQQDSEIGRIPKNWAVAVLGDLIRVAQYGLSVKAGLSGTYPILRMTNQDGGRISSENMKYANLKPGIFEKFRLNKRDIIFNRTNSIDLVGRTAIFDLDGEYTFASYLIRVTLDETKISPYYLNHYFNMEATQRRLKTLATRGVSQSNISATRLRTFKIPLPTLDEQIEIVKLLDSLDAKLGASARKRVLIEQLFAATLNQLMTGQIRVHGLKLEAKKALAAT